jgi:hypothetical protein
LRSDLIDPTIAVHHVAASSSALATAASLSSAASVFGHAIDGLVDVPALLDVAGQTALHMMIELTFSLLDYG